MILGPRSNCARSRSKIKITIDDLDLKKDQDQLKDLGDQDQRSRSWPSSDCDYPGTRQKQGDNLSLTAMK